MTDALLNLFENIADSINPHAEWAKWIGFLSFILFFSLVESELKSIGFIGGIITIWCFGVWLFTGLFSRSETSWTEEGPIPISQIRNCGNLQRIVFTLFSLVWFLGLGGISIAFIFKLAG